MSDTRIYDVTKCARCGEDHPIMVKKLARPVRIQNTVLTHWGTCPAALEPVLMMIVDETEDAAAVHGDVYATKRDLPARVGRQIEGQSALTGKSPLETIKGVAEVCLARALAEPESVMVKCDEETCPPSVRERGSAVIEFCHAHAQGFDFFRLEIDEQGDVHVLEYTSEPVWGTR